MATGWPGGAEAWADPPYVAQLEGWAKLGVKRSLADILGPEEVRRWQQRAVTEPRITPVPGGSETPKERVERLVVEGKMPREAVVRAERYWQDQLQGAVVMPDGEAAWVALDDLYHAIVDPRLARKPERIALALGNVFELRTSIGGRRLGMSTWDEQEGSRFGIVVLDPDGRLRSVHLVDERRLRREQRKGELLWRRLRRPSP